MKKLFKLYSVIEICELIYFLIRTKLLFINARIVRFPIIIKGKKYIQFGKNLTTGVGCRIEAYSQNNTKVLFFGENIQLNDYVHITASNSVIIEDNVLMASKIYISDTIHGSYLGDNNDSSPMIAPINRKNTFKPVKIEKNVWIGEFVSILPGVIIGEGSIIGSNSVVTKNIPKFTIAVGSPAIAIKNIILKH